MRGMIGRSWACAATLAAPALWLALAARARRGKEEPARLPERRGVGSVSRPPGKLVWIHAASVGETMSVLPVLAALRAQEPETGLLLTTGTVTSARLAQERAAASVIHRFLPWDVPLWVARFLDHWRPDVAGFVESEVWPNLLAALDRRSVPRVLINARLSAASFRRWSRAPAFARGLFAGYGAVLAQTEADAARLAALGARRVKAAGDLKFAAPLLPFEPVALQELAAALGEQPRWLAASTHPGEEEAVIAAHRALAPAYPGLVSIIVPRHPERGPEVAAWAAGLKVGRRAEGEPPPAQGGLYVADTLGELGLFYRLARIVFVGGSLVPHGGQNPIEPARLGCAVAVGPHTGNFATATAALAAAGGLTRLADAAALAPFVAAMLVDPAAAASMGAAGAAAGRDETLPARIAALLLDLAAEAIGPTR